MALLHKILFKLTAGRPTRLIEVKGRPYLERYYLGHALGVTFYLHRFVSSDPERHLHNHPWSWGRSLILTGAYTEESVVDLCPMMPNGCLTVEKRRRGWVKIDGHTFHRIKDAKPNTWSLFFHGRRTRLTNPVMGDQIGFYKGWGFLEAGYSNGDKVAIFRPVLKIPSPWWHGAPKGSNSRRQEA